MHIKQQDRKYLRGGMVPAMRLRTVCNNRDAMAHPRPQACRVWPTRVAGLTLCCLRIAALCKDIFNGQTHRCDPPLDARPAGPANLRRVDLHAVYLCGHGLCPGLESPDYPIPATAITLHDCLGLPHSTQPGLDARGGRHGAMAQGLVA